MLSQEELQKENEALKARVQELELLNKWYMEQLKLSRQKQFGASSERSQHEDTAQLNLFNEAEAERQPLVAEPELETVIAARPKKRKRGEKYKALPVEVVEYCLPEEEQACPACGEALHEMSKEVRKELTVIPASVKIIEHVRYVYSCRHCEKNEIQTPVLSAPAPKALLPKSMVSPQLLAYIMTQKFVNAMPLYRQEQDFKRLGVSLSRQNLSNWIIKGAILLQPLLDALKTKLLTHEILHADETQLEVLCEPGRPAQTQSYMWVYRTSGETKTPIVLYDYQEGRSGEFAKKYLSGYSGYLQTDGWNGYQKLEEQGVTLCGCWAHARRKFKEALVVYADPKPDLRELVGVTYCDQLFALEKHAEKLSRKERAQFRQEKVKPLVEAFYAWMQTCNPKPLPQSLLGKAFTYAQNQKTYLLAFLQDARIEVSNNRAERSIKPFVIGRKNWLFCNTPGGAKSSAAIYSLVQTALENELKPLEYLTHIFVQLQQNDNVPIDTLFPWADEIPHQCQLLKTEPAKP
jgi:transposase